MDFLAARRPGSTFLMIGRVAAPEAEVPRRPNLVCLGRWPCDALPAHGMTWDANLRRALERVEVELASGDRARDTHNGATRRGSPVG